ncbi:MAG: DUF3817 domain-containing protein [Phycisphaeraceae bacterium]|nr:DUF3817 domain-containing protein [Phycisphaerales bacterium]MCB9861605.1 DUF3817 domain-containing protein [Phycisphaeraceae bacterium]
MAVNTSFLHKLRIFSMIEGISTILLMGVAVPLKYMADMPIGVKIMGPIHGALFVALVIFFIRGKTVIPLTQNMAIAGIVGAIFPFGPFVVDRWLKRVGVSSSGEPT